MKVEQSFFSTQNSIVNNCLFDNNSGGAGGAIFFDGDYRNILLTNSTFINNYAWSDGGAIRAEGDNITLLDSTFKNNLASSKGIGNSGYGGACLFSNTNTYIENCTFEDNYAWFYGGAIQFRSNNVTILNSSFIKNTAYYEYGGAIYIERQRSNYLIANCTFDGNHARAQNGNDKGGGAITSNAKSLTIINDTFINNYAFRDTASTKGYGGAIYLLSTADYTLIEDSTFDKNSAVNGGAIYSEGKTTSIINCTFTNDHANKNGGAIHSSGENITIINSSFERNDAIYQGGAIDAEGNVVITNCNFTGNTALYAGAIDYYDDNYDNAMNITYAKFNGNNASDGSAIYLDAGNLYIANTEFGKNRADSEELTIDVDNFYHKGENVTVNISFEGCDNIANAIWSDEDNLDCLTFNNITYEVNILGSHYIRTLDAVDVHPVDGYENSNNGEDIWQDPLEDSQLLNVKITNEDGEVILSETGVLTDIAGEVTRVLENLPVGKYKVYSEHISDDYYTYFYATAYFEIIDVLNTTKTTTDTYVTVGDTVTYNITIKNTGGETLSNVTVVENAPEGFILVDYSTDKWTTTDNVTFKYNAEIAENEVITLKLTYNTTVHGRFTNTIKVSSNDTDEIEVESNRVTVHDPEHPVYHPNMTVTKVAENDTIFVEDKAVFIINVTNTGNERLTNVFVIENFDDELIFDNFTSITGEWSLNTDSGAYVFTLPSLGIDKSASFKVYFNTTKSGTFTNNVTVGFETTTEANTTANVTVEKVPTNVTVENITAIPGENITIPINVTPANNKTINDNVTVTFPDGTNQTIEIVNDTGNATWTVPENYTGEYNITVEYDGNETYEPSNGTGIITVSSKIPTHTTVGNVTCNPGDNITIPVTVTADDGIPFNGKITVVLPDGTSKTVEIVNGKGNVDWTVPEDYNGEYNVRASYPGDDHYLPSNGNGFIYVPAYPTSITVGNVTCKPGDNVTIPITVTADDGIPFNGKITVVLPDGTRKTVEIVNGTGNVDWTVPLNYKGTYDVYAFFEGSDHYLPSNGTGFVNVIPDPSPVNPSEPSNKKPVSEVNMNDKVTGNPLIALLVALALLGVGIKSKK